MDSPGGSYASYEQPASPTAPASPDGPPSPQGSVEVPRSPRDTASTATEAIRSPARGDEKEEAADDDDLSTISGRSLRSDMVSLRSDVPPSVRSLAPPSVVRSSPAHKHPNNSAPLSGRTVRSEKTEGEKRYMTAFKEDSFRGIPTRRGGLADYCACGLLLCCALLAIGIALLITRTSWEPRDIGIPIGTLDKANKGKSPRPAPTSMPTSVPTAVPTSVPTFFPSPDNTSAPSPVPSSVPSYVPSYLPTPVPSTAVPSTAPTEFNFYCCFASDSCKQCEFTAPEDDDTWCGADRRRCEGFCEGLWCGIVSDAPTSVPTEGTYTPTSVPSISFEPTGEPTFEPTDHPDAYCCFSAVNAFDLCNTCTNDAVDDDSWCDTGESRCSGVCGGTWCLGPTPRPTLAPTSLPTLTKTPTTVEPTLSPTVSFKPTLTFSPTSVPTVAPTVVPNATAPVVTYGALTVRNASIVSNVTGEPVQLRGMSLAQTNLFLDGGKFYNAEIVRFLGEQWGCTVVRAAMGVESEGGYIKYPEPNRNRVATVVEACIELGLYVIIDWHSHEAEKHTEESVNFFGKMAKLYGSHHNVIFEVYHEPAPEAEWSLDIKPYAETVIDAIRGNGSTNLVIVGTKQFSQKFEDPAAEPVARDNVAYALHFYAASADGWLRDRAVEAIELGVPLFVSEFGTTEAHGDGEVDKTETLRWIEFLDEHKISYCNWAMTDADQSSSALLPGASPRPSDWNFWDYSKSARVVRDIFFRALAADREAARAATEALALRA